MWRWDDFALFPLLLCDFSLLNLPALSARRRPISLVVSLCRNSSGLRVLPEGFLCWLSVLHAWLQGQSLL